MTPPIYDIPYGYCHCRCGQLAPLARRTDRNAGIIKGLPRKFIQGHQKKIRPIIEDAVPFKIDGVYCRLIALTQGQHTIVWASDYERVMEAKWQAQFNKSANSFYAIRRLFAGDGNRQKITLHRFILGLSSEDDREPDHINGNTLDNRYDNLRPATRSENCCNRRTSSQNTSGYKGVGNRKNIWFYRIKKDGKCVYVSGFATREAAFEARCVALKVWHGEFARPA